MLQNVRVNSLRYEISNFSDTKGAIVLEASLDFHDIIISVADNNLQDSDTNNTVYLGAALSIDISESENSDYRIFNAGIFVHDISLGITNQLANDVATGENDCQCRFSPSVGGVIFTRTRNFPNAIPSVFTLQFGQNENDKKNI